MHTMVTSLFLRSSRASRAGAILLLALPPVAAGLMAAGATPASAASPQSAASDEVLVHYRGDPGEQRVSVPAGQSVAGALTTLRDDPAVGYARPDYLVHAARFWPNDPGQ